MQQTVNSVHRYTRSRVPGIATIFQEKHNASIHRNNIFSSYSGRGWGRRLAVAFGLVAFQLSIITPVKKSVNHSRTVVSMCETGWEH